MAHVITQSCCGDASCTEVCPVDCIHPAGEADPGIGNEMLYIDPDTCIDCGSCVIECPVGAIYPEPQLPPALREYAAVNRAATAALPAPGAVPRRVLRTITVPEETALRVAIIGSGASSAYALEELLARTGARLRVDIFDRVPTPWGLVRSGVAPDHLATKRIAQRFDTWARDPRVRLLLNVEIGQHVELVELAEHYHAIVVATGAPESRRLGLPGEELSGVHGAADFAAWANGHPDFSADLVDLRSSAEAVVVGNGNVALDVARLLTLVPALLPATGLASHAVEALAGSSVRRVSVLGRRGATALACTTSELRALGRLDGVRVRISGDPLTVDHAVDHATAQKLALLRDLAARDRAASGPVQRVIHFRFNARIAALGGAGRLAWVQVRDGDEPGVELIHAGLVFKAIGQRSRPLPGLPYDEDRAAFVQAGGRLLDPETGLPLPGRYVAGWAKRGATGVLGTNRVCSQESVGALLADLAAGRLRTPVSDPDAVLRLVESRQPDLVTGPGWDRIDAYEKRVGARHGRPRFVVADRSWLVRIGQQGEAGRAGEEW